MSNEARTNISGAVPAPGSEELLRDTLKRCSIETLEAALNFRKTGDVFYVAPVVLGIVARFLDPEVAGKLENGDDSIRFMEDLGMDSLTMIEAVFMVEEALSISIKNEELMHLRTVGDLKTFIQEKISGESKGELKERYTIEQIAAIMPQQAPFLFLEEAILQERSATGRYEITGQETFLEGHFKGNPVFPASILLEALGQLAVFLLLKNPPQEIESEVDTSEVYFTGMDGVRCHRVCKPGEVLDLAVQVKRARESLAIFSGQITVSCEKTVVVEELTLAYKYANEPAYNPPDPSDSAE